MAADAAVDTTSSEITGESLDFPPPILSTPFTTKASIWNLDAGENINSVIWHPQEAIFHGANPYTSAFYQAQA